MKDKIFIFIVIVLAVGLAVILSLSRPAIFPEPTEPIVADGVTSSPAVEPSPSEIIVPPLQPVGYATTLVSPTPGEFLQSPLRVRGTMPGSWYFEATAGVVLLDEKGVEIGQTYATAEGEWMTDGPVLFTADLTFSYPATFYGTLILKADNPSGLSEYDKEERYEVKFLLNNDRPSRY